MSCGNRYLIHPQCSGLPCIQRSLGEQTLTEWLGAPRSRVTIQQQAFPAAKGGDTGGRNAQLTGEGAGRAGRCPCDNFGKTQSDIAAHGHSSHPSHMENILTRPQESRIVVWAQTPGAGSSPVNQCRWVLTRVLQGLRPGGLFFQPWLSPLSHTSFFFGKLSLQLNSFLSLRPPSKRLSPKASFSFGPAFNPLSLRT